ncbi:MAG: aminotransferase class III-fold pyridoxal phosphate-dependent enzyme [Rhodospirillales bacterium]
MTQQDLVERARAVLPGAGFGNFDASFVIREGKGAHIWDEDGNEYIDFLIGSGPMILGHCHPEVVEAVQEQVAKGSTFFASNAHGIELAEEICRAVACAEQVRFTSTGSEADMFAMRLARAHTGRDKILKFEGGYHGMSAEGQMSLAPDRMMNYPVAVPDSAGIPDAVRDDMLVAPYNDIAFFRSLIAERGHEIAAVIVEPLQRIIPPLPGFLEALREECTRNGMVLIFDEVVTGFRLAYGGAQEVYGVTPDVCTLGKIIGGGFPMAAIAGKAHIMAHFDAGMVGKDKALMQIGTLSGNPVAAVAGLKSMEILRRPGQYDHLYAVGETLIKAINEHLGAAGQAHHVAGCPVLFDIVFAGGPMHNYRDVIRNDAKKAARFNAVLRDQGIFKSPSKFYPCLALTDDDVAQTVAAIARAAASLND